MLEVNVLRCWLATVLGIADERKQRGTLRLSWVMVVGSANKTRNVRAVEAPAVSGLLVVRDANSHGTQSCLSAASSARPTWLSSMPHLDRSELPAVVVGPGQ